MLDSELVCQAVRLLSTAIGMIMEDHVDQALSIDSATSDPALRAERLAGAGRDIAVLADAAGILLRRCDLQRENSG